MIFKNLFILFAIIFHLISFSSCKKDPVESESKYCKINKTGTINFNLSDRLSLDPVDVIVNGEFIDSLFIYAMNENEKDHNSLTKPSGDYKIVYPETESYGGTLVVA